MHSGHLAEHLDILHLIVADDLVTLLNWVSIALRGAMIYELRSRASIQRLHACSSIMNFWSSFGVIASPLYFSVTWSLCWIKWRALWLWSFTWSKIFSRSSLISKLWKNFKNSLSSRTCRPSTFYQRNISNFSKPRLTIVPLSVLASSNTFSISSSSM